MCRFFRLTVFPCSAAAPRRRFEFTARFADPADAANPTTAATRADFPEPLVPSSEHTPTVQVHGAQANARAPFRLRTLDLHYGSRVRVSDLPGTGAEAEIVAREPSGQIALQMPSVAHLAVVAKAAAGAAGAFRLVHGNVPGNTVTLDMPAVQLASPTYSDSDGYWHVQTQIKPLPVGGNDEIRLTVT